jgi:hypothetical protein
VALFVHEGLSCRLDYSIACSASWVTKSARVSGWLGDRTIDIRIEHDGSWTLNGAACPQVDGCLDVDLNFSPSTNLLPIRRLSLAVGQRAAVRAAWLRFPSFTLEPLEQTYTRLAERTYRYESAGGKFVAELEVDQDGLPVTYGKFWASEAR